MKKPQLSTADIEHLAELADLKLTPEQRHKIGAQLTETLDYIQNLRELKTDKVKETNHTVNLVNEFFMDGTKNTRQISSEEVFKNAKNHKDSYFSVKKIL